MKRQMIPLMILVAALAGCGEKSETAGGSAVAPKPEEIAAPNKDVKCDIPAPYQTLCNYKAENTLNANAYEDSFGIRSHELTRAVRNSGTRFPAQVYLALAMQGNVDAMIELSSAFDNKDWKEYWDKKAEEVMGMPRRPSLQTKVPPEKLAQAYDELLKRTSSEFVKQQLSCRRAQLLSKASNTPVETFLEPLATKGYECAIRSISTQERLKALEKEEAPNLVYTMEKLLSLPETEYAHDIAMNCYSGIVNYTTPSTCPKGLKPDIKKALYHAERLADVKAKNISLRTDGAYKGVRDYILFKVLTDHGKLLVRRSTVRLQGTEAEKTLGVIEGTPAMLEDGIAFLQKAAQIETLKDDEEYKAMIYALAVLLDPASGLRQGAEVDDIVNLLNPKGDACRNDGSDTSGCSILKKYLIHESDNNKYRDFLARSIKYFEINEINENQSAIDNFLNKHKARSSVTQRLGHTNACIHNEEYRKSKINFLATCNEVQSSLVILRGENDAIIKEGGRGLYDALVGSSKDLEEINKRRFYRSLSQLEVYNKINVEMDVANFKFDQFYVDWLRDKLTPLFKFTFENRKKIDFGGYGVPHSYEATIPVHHKAVDSAMAVVSFVSKNCSTDETDDSRGFGTGKYLPDSCILDQLGSLTSLTANAYYKEAKQAGSIYALIVDGTLKPRRYGAPFGYDNNDCSNGPKFVVAQAITIYKPPFPVRSTIKPFNQTKYTTSIDLIFSNQWMNPEWLAVILDKHSLRNEYSVLQHSELYSFEVALQGGASSFDAVVKNAVECRTD